MGIKVTFFGCRGSMPTPAADKMKYGGNTSSVCIECHDQIFLFDAGSGLALFSEYYKKNHYGKKINLFLSHYHTDHICGISASEIFYDKNIEISLYGGNFEGKSPKEILGVVCSPPYFPLPVFTYGGNVKFESISDGDELCFGGGIKITAGSVNHPGGCLGFLFECCGKKIVYLTDYECENDLGQRLSCFLKTSDLLIWDAFFTAETFIPGWGHSSMEQGAELLEKFGVKKIYFYHHNINSTDGFLDSRAEEFLKTGKNIYFAKEGETVVI